MGRDAFAAAAPYRSTLLAQHISWAYIACLFVCTLHLSRAAALYVRTLNIAVYRAAALYVRFESLDSGDQRLRVPDGWASCLDDAVYSVDQAVNAGTA